MVVIQNNGNITIWHHQGKWTWILIEFMLTFFHFTLWYGRVENPLMIFPFSMLPYDSDVLPLLREPCQPLCLWKFAVLCCYRSTGTLVSNHTKTVCVCEWVSVHLQCPQAKKILKLNIINCVSTVCESLLVCVCVFVYVRGISTSGFLTFCLQLWIILDNHIRWH